MRDEPRRKRSRARSPEALTFARQQRAGASEFALDLWQLLRGHRCHGQKFRREHPIPPYTADFCCVALKLVIEVDGAPHWTIEGQCHDQERDRFLAARGYKIVRVPGYQITQDAAGVMDRIEAAIAERLAELGGATVSNE